MRIMDTMNGDGNNALRVKLYRDKAIKELDLMHQAIVEGDYGAATQHKIIANVAIDEMVNLSNLIQGNKE